MSDEKCPNDVVREIAHDLNNMLTVILGTVEMLADDIAPDDPKHELVETTMIAAERCAQLAARLLGVSRETAGL